MTCKGALRREFPDRAAVISRDRFQDCNFLKTLVGVLHELDSAVAPAARPKVKKAGVIEPEERDTIDIPFSCDRHARRYHCWSWH